MFLFSGIVLLAFGALGAANSLHIVRRAVRVWPRELDRRGSEAMASYEFLVRFVALVVALIGIGLILLDLLSL